MLFNFEHKFAREGLTFDDVLIVPAASSVMPREASTVTRLTRSISMNIPILSAAMDTVTEARLAIALAREGGMGVIHRNLSIKDQAQEVDKVKRSESGMITDPITLEPHQPLSEAQAVMKRFHISGIPITEQGKLVGILTNRDMRFEADTTRPISELMTKERLITVPVGTTLEEARDSLHRYKIEKLLVIDEHGNLRGLITMKDIQKKILYPNASKDDFGRLRVGAAVGVGPDTDERCAALIEEGADLLVVDTSHGHSQMVIETVARVKDHFGKQVQLMAGNVVTAEATEALIRAGVDAVKVGVGPASICTTRVIAGVGVPQISAVFECASVARKYGVPVVSDGGIQYSGDIAKAIAAGADTVMLGSLLAGVDESPGEWIISQGERFKDYRGMGSVGAMKQRSFSKDRYFQGDITDEVRLIAEGIEGRVAYKGMLAPLVYQLVGGLRQAMGYAGCATIAEMQEKTCFVRITGAGLRESHPHDVHIVKEAPNYSLAKES
ncbi:inosine-5'-monophosphate dehydrogenase [Reticulibacter mediterranei]|uniref:Inosine-5'-monophosphate dehydrogenase n=1 Tax=Reticulibacter mediterranei TaxID=2778369 RepID=A0A8J3MZI8_9CHLR|nr:IMP dehydrogenase [Reticulibacter mediterranei]GHO90503.1 inosine-5'-monophosphate dehydrogenase [Reticulibacter mediterranei]